VFVFNNDETQYLPLVQSYYPDGKQEPIQCPIGRCYTYSVSAARAMSRHGMLLTLSGEGSPPKETWQGRVPLVGAMPEDLRVTYPVTATWSGLMYVPQDGPVRLSVESEDADQIMLRVQGQRVSPGATLLLGAGWVPFSIQTHLSATPSLRLEMQQGTSPPNEVGTGRLWAQPPNAGLQATIEGAKITHRVDQFVGSSVWSPESPTFGGIVLPPSERDPDLLPLALLGAKSIRWQGELYAEGGSYSMTLRTDARALLLIDGSSVLDVPANNTSPPHYLLKGGEPGTSAPIQLTPGWHHVQLNLEQAEGDSAGGLEWSWTRPDGTYEIVPPSNLRYMSADQSAKGRGGLELWWKSPGMGAQER
jgi:hypothetical protein